MNPIKKIFGTYNDRELRRMRKLVAKINQLEEQTSELDDDALRAFTSQLKAQLDAGKTLDNLLPEAFAAVRVAAQRTLGLRHFDVQLIGGISLHEGKIAEMRTGEGKTLVATLAAYLNAVSGEGVHIVTVNDYLARRDAHWMAPVYGALGMTVGVIQSSGAFGPNQASFVIDFDYHGDIPNFPHLRVCSRSEAYACDITYGTNNEYGFDYLRDNMVLRKEQRVQRALNFAVVDEVDSILIDEARTPLVISGVAEDSSATYREINTIVPSLELGYEETGEGDFIVDEKQNSIELTEQGHQKVENLLIERKLLQEDDSLYAPQNLNLLHHVQTALRAYNLFNRDVEYIVQNGEVVLIDPHTGRKMPGRRLGEGVHQAIEAKEKVEIRAESQTLASTTFQNFFRLYKKLSGMTGTADTEATEFQQIYGLTVVVIPTNRESSRQDLNDLIFLTKEEKLEAVIEDIKHCQQSGAPVLVGTVSIGSSEEMSALLTKNGIQHQVLNAKFHEQEAEIVAQAGRPGHVTIATNMAGRGTDIVLGGNLQSDLAGVDPSDTAKIAELTELQKQRQTQVLEAGGLHIIGTERHESRRIDNQLRGRAGRQGDPGVSRFYLSMEDNLMRLFASDRVRGIMQSIGMERGEAIEHRMVTGSIEKAQRKVEGRNFDIRKQLLEYDDVSNDQRLVVYEQRNELLDQDDISDIIENMRADVANDLVLKYMPPGSFDEQWDLAGLEQALLNEFGVSVEIQAWMKADASLGEADVQARVLTQMRDSYNEKMDRFQESLRRSGEEVDAQATVHRLERDLMLQVLDRLWKEHLATMDHLRRGIGLRSYGGKNPKQEFKREAFELFSALLERIKFDVIRILSRSELASPEQIQQMEAAKRERERLMRERMQLQHEQASGLASEAEPERADSAPQSASSQGETFVRPERKVGRNEPCPCGSGKKYKQCCGKI